jgi:CheY-like chemotaxis protein
MTDAPAPTILVVDDDPMLSTMVRIMLERSGFAAVVFNSGQAALEWLTTHQPAAIVLDVMMPDLDGYGVLQAVRASPDTHNLPVVMLTALHDSESRETAARAGANAYLTKPVARQTLVETLRRALAPVA